MLNICTYRSLHVFGHYGAGCFCSPRSWHWRSGASSGGCCSGSEISGPLRHISNCPPRPFTLLSGDPWWHIGSECLVLFTTTDGGDIENPLYSHLYPAPRHPHPPLPPTPDSSPRLHPDTAVTDHLGSQYTHLPVTQRKPNHFKGWRWTL